MSSMTKPLDDSSFITSTCVRRRRLAHTSSPHFTMYVPPSLKNPVGLMCRFEIQIQNRFVVFLS